MVTLKIILCALGVAIVGSVVAIGAVTLRPTAVGRESSPSTVAIPTPATSTTTTTTIPENTTTSAYIDPETYTTPMPTTASTLLPVATTIDPVPEASFDCLGTSGHGDTWTCTGSVAHLPSSWTCQGGSEQWSCAGTVAGVQDQWSCDVAGTVEWCTVQTERFHCEELTVGPWGCGDSVSAVLGDHFRSLGSSSYSTYITDARVSGPWGASGAGLRFAEASPDPILHAVTVP